MLNHVKASFSEFLSKLLSILTHKKAKPFVIFILVCISRNTFWKMYNKIRGYPDGKMGLPFFGCLFQFGRKPRKFLFSVADQYGPLAYVPLVMSNNIIVSDPQILKTLYKHQKIIDRPSFFASRPPPKLFSDINNKEWERRRKYCSTTVMLLANSPFVLSTVKKCINNFIPIMDKKYVENNELCYPQKYFHYISFNTIWSAVFDKILPFNDPFIKSYCQVSDKFINKLGVGILLDTITNGHTPDFMKRNIVWKYTKDVDKLLFDWMNNNGFVVDLGKKLLYRKNDNISDNKISKVYIDFLLEKLKKKETTIYEIICDIQLVLSASIDTTSKSSEFGFLLLAKYPKIQEMVYNEIISVMKKYNLKEFDSKILSELHIFRAFIYEALRISSVAPLPAPHATVKEHEIDVNGKTVIIPKDYTLQTNLYYMLKYLDWGNNNKPLKKENNSFHLEYWLDPITKKFKMNENFVQFGVGKRDCPGQSLAMRALYTMYGILLIKYKFVAPNNDPTSIHIKQKFGIVMPIDPPVGIHVEKRC
eukprot:199795_1